MWLRQRTYLARSPLEQRASHGLPEPQKTESRCERSWPRSDPCPCVHLPQRRLLPFLPTLRISPVTIIHPSKKSSLRFSLSLSLLINVPLTHRHRSAYASLGIYFFERKRKKKKTKKRETKKKKKKKLNHHHLHATIVEKDNYPHDENKKRPTIVRFPEIENSKNEASFDPPSNICQSFGTSSSEQCHLINICLLFSPSSLLETWSKRQPRPDIPTPYPIYPVLEFRRSFRYARPATKTGRNAPQRRQEPDERGWDVTLPKLVTGQQRGHCIKYWLDRASSCRFFAIDPNPEIRFTIALRLSSPRFQNWSGVFTFSGTRVNMSFSVTGNDHPG